METGGKGQEAGGVPALAAPVPDCSSTPCYFILLLVTSIQPGVAQSL